MLVKQYESAVKGARESFVNNRKTRVPRRERREEAAALKRKVVKKEPPPLEDNRPTVFSKGRAKVIKEPKYPLTYKQQQLVLQGHLWNAYENLDKAKESGSITEDQYASQMVVVCKGIIKSANPRSKYPVSARKRSAGTTSMKTERKASSAGVYANDRHHSRSVYISPEQRKANKISDGKPIMNTKHKPVLVSTDHKVLSVPKKCGPPTSRKARLKLEAAERKFQKGIKALEKSISKAA